MSSVLYVSPARFSICYFSLRRLSSNIHPPISNASSRICAATVSSQRCYRGSYRQHATKGVDVNKGDPGRSVGVLVLNQVSDPISESEMGSDAPPGVGERKSSSLPRPFDRYPPQVEPFLFRRSIAR